MASRRLLTIVLGLSALTALPLLGPSATAAPTTPGAVRGAVVVEGQVERPIVVTTAELRTEYAQVRLTVTFLSGSTEETHTYRGALLLDVLDSAVPTFDPNQKNDKLRYAVLVAAADGYQASVAWGEIDPEFADTQVLLAYSEDGRPLARPRLVVPGDERGGRYVTDVVSVSLWLPQP